MNRAQIVALTLVIALGGVAYMLFSGDSPPPPVVEAPPPSPVDQVLVTARDLSYGAEVTEADVSWIDWPKASIPEGVLTKSGNPDAVQELKSSYVRIPLSVGEPVRKERLIKGATAGLLSTMLSPGKRAVAIDVSVNSTAGGFISPNDHVDILRTYRDADASRELGRDVFSSEVLLTNVRVLAMGQTIEKKGSEPVTAGPTATLELDPQQAEFIVLSQRMGQLTLVLRPIMDSLASQDSSDSAPSEKQEDSVTVVKGGVSVNFRLK